MSTTSATGFASVVLDVDSTLCGIEGIDWLATRRGADTGAAVTDLTDRAMRGEITLESVYGQRLALVAPGRDDITALAHAYSQSLAPGAASAIAAMRAAGRRVVLVSGGLREAILPVASQIGIQEHDVHAVAVSHDVDGTYAGYDLASPLATASGKRAVVGALGLHPRVIAVGDGATDLAMRLAVDCFAAFTGFVHRDAVVDSADVVVSSFAHLQELVLA